MSESRSKSLNVLLAIIALFCFMGLDFVGYGSKRISGTDFLDMASEMEKVWPFLYVLIPIVQIIARALVNERKYAILSSFLMFIPIVVTFSEMGDELDRLQIGFYVYLVISIGIVITAFIIEEETSTETIHVNAATIESEKKRKEIREEYDNDRLHKVLSQPEMYNESLVEECRRELEIRNNADKIISEVENYDDDKIDEILSNQTTYSEALVFCCEKIKAKRIQLLQEEEAKKAEEERIRKQQEAEEERKRQELKAEQQRQRYTELWRKYKIHTYIAVAILFVFAIIVYLNSDGRRYSKGIAAFEERNMKEAIEWLSKVGDNYDKYSSATYMLYESHLAQKDSTAAADALVKSVKDNNWNVNPDAYKTYALHLIKGTFRPFISPASTKAAQLMSTSEDRAVRLAAAELYFKSGDYANAYKIFDSEAYGNGLFEKKASGYIGLYYLFGLNGIGKDLKKAKEYLDKASNEAPFLDYKLVFALAQISGAKKYADLQEIKTQMLRLKNEFIGAVNRNELERIVEELFDYKLEYGQELAYWGDGWRKYDYNNESNKGSYEGMSGSWNGGNGAHNGWGCFVGYNKTTKTNYVNLGKFHQCNLHGSGIIAEINYEKNSLRIWYGKNWDKGTLELENSERWTNDAIDYRCFIKFDIDLPF